MGLSFLAPALFAGIGFLIAPYLIHQIRRPEREPLRFSSLLFIPDARKEVIERRRVQHVWLMLLRMLLLLLLALAFARPYWKALAAHEANDVVSRHIILLDTSYSMGTSEHFDEAKRAALALLDEVKSGELVGVAGFARAPRELAPLQPEGDPESDSIARARRAIEGATLTDEATAYLPALQYAQMQFAAAGKDGDGVQSVVHLISDFQRSGMPERYAGWKLPPNVALHSVPIGVGAPPVWNLGVVDLSVRKMDATTFRVVAKVKNWSDQDANDVEIQLVVEGKAPLSNTLSVRAGNATQTSFHVERAGDASFEGVVVLAQDDLALDNRRYFAWNVPPKQRVLLVSDAKGDGRDRAAWRPGLFFANALRNEAGLPWQTEIVSSQELPQALADPTRRPAVAVVCDIDGLSAELARELAQYVRLGGRLLLSLTDDIALDTLSGSLLSDARIGIAGLEYEQMRESRFELMSWVDLDHPIFMPFRGTRFNDFSSLRFRNHYVLEADSAQVIARLDDGCAAMVETTLGKGRIIIWAFPVQLDWTNLPKSKRFIPILHETLQYLGASFEKTAEWEVGRRVPADWFVVNSDGMSVAQIPGIEGLSEFSAENRNRDGGTRLAKAGILKTRAPEAPDWAYSSAVNVDADEGNMARIEVPEFQLKVASASAVVEDTREGLEGSRSDLDRFIVEAEYGRNLLFALFALLFLESWYMSRLKKKK